MQERQIKRYKKITPQSMRELSERIINYFDKKGYWSDCAIYVDGERWSSDNYGNSNKIAQKTKKDVVYYVEYDIDVNDYLKYNNPKAISIIFDGSPLYMEIFNNFDIVWNLSERFLAPYKLYFELGDQWNMTAYSI